MQSSDTGHSVGGVGIPIVSDDFIPLPAVAASYAPAVNACKCLGPAR